MKPFLPLNKALGFIAISAAALALTVSAHATVTLTFEGLGDNTPIGNYYNGGAGTNYGISFGTDSLSLVANSDGGSGNFSNNPSGDTVMYFLSGPGDIMNVAAGFDTGFSFYYAASGGGLVSVWSGLDGTGTLLASLTLPSTASPYSVWDAEGVTFAGIAQSVDFSGGANYIAFDNITLGSETAGTGAAAPDQVGTLLCLTLAVAGLFGLRRFVPSRNQA